MTADPLDDSVGIRLAQLLRPRAVAGIELAGRVALRPRRQLLELHPDHPRALGRARRVEGHRLPERDRRLGREQAAVGFVDGPRDPVEAGREVEERRAREPLVALASAAARSSRCGSASRRGRSGSGAPRRGRLPCVALPEQPAVQLRRRHAGEHGARGWDRLAVREPDRGCATLRDEDPLDVRLRPQLAAGVADDCRRDPRRGSTPPPFGTGIPPSWRAQAITCVMKPDTAWSGRARLQHPRRQQAVGALVRNVSVSQSRAESSVCPRTRRARARPSCQ